MVRLRTRSGSGRDLVPSLRGGWRESQRARGPLPRARTAALLTAIALSFLGCDSIWGRSAEAEAAYFDTPAPSAAEAVPMPTLPLRADQVTYPTDAIAFIAGPQLKMGSSENPWPWFDTNARIKGLEHGAAFPATPTNDDDYLLLNYYDQALVQYINFYRSENPAFREHARKIADSYWMSRWMGGGTVEPESALPPRNASLGGLMLRAMDGRPEMWPWITSYVRAQYDVWLGTRLGGEQLHYGIRDGGYMLTYAAWLGAAHPDAAVREEMKAKALTAARDYFARLQYPDGSWRWREDPAGSDPVFEQPFMVGLLMEGLIAVHQQSGDPVVRLAILKGVDHILTSAYRRDSFSQFDGGEYRGMWYFLYGAECNPPIAGPCGAGEPMPYPDMVREVRQLNPLLLHAIGYAYRLTGETKYTTAGDEIFSATFGKGQGPGSDQWYGLADFRAREYNQSYRSAGRYLAWR